MGTLMELAAAIEAFEAPGTVLALAARALGEACPRGMALAVIFGGWPARTVLEGRASDAAPREAVEGYRRVYPLLPVRFDRYHVGPRDRNRWREILGDGLGTPEQLKADLLYSATLQPLGALEHGRMVVCAGARPIAHLSCGIPEGTSFRQSERRALERTALAVAGPVRVAGRLQAVDAAVAAVDHLMGEHSDASVLASAGGQILSSSPSARRHLSARPELAAAIGRAVREHRRGVGEVVLSRWDLTLHVTPCSPRGSAAAYLVLIGSTAPPEVGRLRVTERHAELLGLVAQGLTNQEIADRMAVAPTTVKTWLQRLYRQAGVRNRVELARWAERPR